MTDRQYNIYGPSNPQVFFLLLPAFLSPDDILTGFVGAGKDGLNSELQAVIADPDTFDEALSELERFSLIVRQ
jgi:hypothetical protein